MEKPTRNKFKIPSLKTLERWINQDSGCESTDGCWVELDGYCEHGKPSWLIRLGRIEL